MEQVTLTEKEYQWLRRIQHAVEAPNYRPELLTRWEQGFLHNLLTRFRVQRVTTRVTPKMWAVITGIGDKIVT